MISIALLMPVVIGFAGLGTEVGLWLYKNRVMQSAADSAAVSAATSISSGANNWTQQAEAVAASYGFVNDANGVGVTVNRPPTSGNYTSLGSAIEVIVMEPQQRLFSILWDSQPLIVSARAVALADGGDGCVLALNPTASGAITLQGNAEVKLNSCSLFDNSEDEAALNVGGSASLTAFSVSVVGDVSGESNITTTTGISTGVIPAKDPYAASSFPSFSGCDYNNFTSNTKKTLNPGVYCGGMQFNANAAVTLTAGIYYIDGGTFRVNGNATLSGDGVTLVFTSSSGNDWPTATINGGANVHLIAPDSGPTAGIAIFGDRDMPEGTSFKFNGGASQVIGGAIYLSKGDVSFAGGADTTTGCTQLVVDTVTFTGNSNFSINCEDYGTRPLGVAATLVE